ncbi:MAG: hypothetical protein A2741_02950 [Candidatus Zambryskibacteria bacterium RIFCSPHIGHO2_01_FULL_43_27]|uniref:Radical SAM core domain-containing protein n=1 Tax=Candidatus Zambryskibacteria bacterium RIFCSPLOWO2_01_FULL_43_17 TaxID=1802760 RepID=A0A1G2U5F8_9BACT|nr:MAG: hypothetical protein A2741_02950 [Candidatus Zambryskibacteria bacterium RIFCSPHIGHO2_01_FULL_43_27]OHB04112.1 MAG: hypothetical protein A2920_02120 [Candidatus Zambryskibacteria bacterium RIFCSPLOWO2_01_FULL_43_17]
MPKVLEVIPHSHRAHPSDRVAQLQSDALKGCRVLFINMPLRETAKPNTPPQGPGLMAARLRQYGAEPSIVDLNAYRVKDRSADLQRLPNGRHLSYEEALELLSLHIGKHGEPDVIGLSGKITTLRWQEAIAKICRKMMPDAFIVSGGGLATEVKLPFLNWIPELDAIAHSEGDDIILLIANDVLKAKQSAGLNWRSAMTESAYYAGEIGGKPKFMYEGDRPENLDILPFAAWDLLHEDVLGNKVLEWYIETPVWGLAANNSSAAPFSMKRSLTTVSSRGCPFACNFCYRGAQGERNYGIRSAENLRKEAEWLIKEYGVDFIGFPDDNFAVSAKRMAELPQAFEGLDFRWGTHTRLDEADERFEPMALAGCKYIGFGAESASAFVLEQMNKGGHILRPKGSKENKLVRINGFDFPETMVKGIRKTREVGMHANCTWMMGYPGERLEDLKTSVAFILWQVEEVTQGIVPGTPEYAAAVASINQRMFTATAYPGTAMFKHPKVQAILHEHFGLNFDMFGQPVADEALRKYILELDDATKVLHGVNGSPIYYGAMPMDEFLEARDYVDSGQIAKILNM